MFQIPIALTLLSALIVFGGFRLSRRAARPRLLRVGVVTTAGGLMLLWVLPVWFWTGTAEDWALPVFIGTMLVSVSVLGLGIQLVARACGAREEGPIDRVWDDFVIHNELP